MLFMACQAVGHDVVFAYVLADVVVAAIASRIAAELPRVRIVADRAVGHFGNGGSGRGLLRVAFDAQPRRRGRLPHVRLVAAYAFLVPRRRLIGYVVLMADLTGLLRAEEIPVACIVARLAVGMLFSARFYFFVAVYAERIDMAVGANPSRRDSRRGVRAFHPSLRVRHHRLMA